MNTSDPATGNLPRDTYSATLRQLKGHPESVEKTSTVDLQDFYGNAETWVVKTVRVNGHDTVFLQKNDAGGGGRWVLPPEITAVIARQRDGIHTVNRKRGARKAAATREALGQAPAFLRGKRTKRESLA